MCPKKGETLFNEFLRDLHSQMNIQNFEIEPGSIRNEGAACTSTVQFKDSSMDLQLNVNNYF